MGEWDSAKAWSRTSASVEVSIDSKDSKGFRGYDSRPDNEQGLWPRKAVLVLVSVELLEPLELRSGSRSVEVIVEESSLIR